MKTKAMIAMAIAFGLASGTSLIAQKTPTPVTPKPMPAKTSPAPTKQAATSTATHTAVKVASKTHRAHRHQMKSAGTRKTNPSM